MFYPTIPRTPHGRHWKFCDKCSVSLTGIPWILWIWSEFQQNQNWQNSGIPQDFESAGFGILYKLPLSFLDIMKFLGTQFSVVHLGGGGGDIFQNSPLYYKFFVFVSCIWILDISAIIHRQLVAMLQVHIRSVYTYHLAKIYHICIVYSCSGYISRYTPDSLVLCCDDIEDWFVDSTVSIHR